MEQEAISLAELGKLYYRVLLQKTRAKRLLTRVTQLVLTLHRRNLTQEKWFQVGEYRLGDKMSISS